MITRSGFTKMNRNPPVETAVAVETAEAAGTQTNTTTVPETPRNETPAPARSRHTATASTIDARDDMAAEIGRAIARALQAQTRGRNEINRTVCPTFSGLEHESPTEFLIKIREYADSMEIVEDEEIINLISRQLRGDASRWFAPLSAYIKTCPEFEARFKGKYDDISTRARLQAKLYSEAQKENESVTLFILKKRALFHRLEPLADDAAIIPVVTELIRSPIRAYLRTQHFFLLDELDTAATRIEEDLRAAAPPFRRIVTNNGTAPPRPPTQALPPANPTNSAVRPSKPPPAEPTQSGSRPTTSTNTGASAKLPPTPCRFCGEWHYNNRCPQNPFRPHQGNTQGAGGTSNNQSRNPPAQ